MNTYNVCRFCGDYAGWNGHGDLIKYGPRHYAHAECGLQKQGVHFLEKLSPRALERFPFMIAAKAGLGKELTAMIEDSKVAVRKK